MVQKYPAVPFLFSTIIGIVAADLLSVPAWPLLLLCFISFTGTVYFYFQKRAFYVSISLLVLFALMSAFHFSLNFIEKGSTDIRNVVSMSSPYDIYAEVSDWPDIKPHSTELRLDVDSVSCINEGFRTTRVTTGGLLLKVSDSSTVLQRGDKIHFCSRIYLIKEKKSHFGEFNYGAYLNLKGVYGTVFLPTLHSVKVDRRIKTGYLSLVDNLRSLLIESFKRNLSPLSKALAGGFLIGEIRNIPPSVYNSFRDSGTLHLLAVSGSNVALVIIFALFLMRPINPGKVTRSVILMAIITIFVGISYADPSVMRASIMASLVIIARLLSRTYDLNNIIALTALIILLVDPAQFYDVGFQLSFVTAWGLIFMMPRVIPIFDKVKERRWCRWFLFPLLISAVAQICSTPIIAYYFDRLPLLSLPANLLIVPAVSIGVLGLQVMLVADFIFPLLGFWIGSFVDIWMRFILELLNIFSGDNVSLLDTGEVFDGISGLLLVIAIYIMIGLGTISLKSRQARRSLLFFTLITVNLVLIFEVTAGQDSKGLQLEFRSIPGGISVVVWSEGSDKCDLVITSVSGKDYRIDERVITPYLNENGIDRIENLFLLSAEYKGIDDILRLAERFKTSRLYIAPNIKQSLADVLIQNQSIHYSGDIILLKFLSKGELKRGFSAYENGLVLTTGDHRFDILIDYSGIKSLPNDQSIKKTLIAGAGSNISVGEWGEFLSLGYSEIICSKVEQVTGAREFDLRLETENFPPPSVIELAKISYYRRTVEVSTGD